MASSNRHWPSMFKSKPCNSHHQWQHEINSSLISNGGQRTPQASVGCEERSPEPKPRWNPRPEQIRILEAIFNSGMVNPPRDEIRKIRAQLQEYGQVGDANVFYWFQNRKSRSKHKQRHIQTTTTTNNKSQRLQNPLITSTAAAPTTKTTPSSSSSSSEISSQTSPDKALSLGSKNLLAASSSPTPSGNQPFYQTHCAEFLPVPFFFPVQQPPPTVASTAPAFSQGFCFTDAPNVCHVVDSAIENSSGLLLSDLLLMNHGPTKKVEDDKVKLQQQLSYSTITTAPSTTTQSIFSPTSISALSTIGQAQGVGETAAVGPTKSTVFINDVAFEVTTSLFDVREVFGDDAVLLHSSGQPVLTNEWGVTLQPLQHGAFYYLIRTLTSSTHGSTIDLI